MNDTIMSWLLRSLLFQVSTNRAYRAPLTDLLSSADARLSRHPGYAVVHSTDIYAADPPRRTNRPSQTF